MPVGIGLSAIFLYNLVSFIATLPVNKAIVAPVASQNSKNEFKKLLDEYNIPIKSIRYRSDNAEILVETTDDVVVVLSAYKDPKWQVALLQNILSRVSVGQRSMESRQKPTRIDLRFDKPIVTY